MGLVLFLTTVRLTLLVIVMGSRLTKGTNFWPCKGLSMLDEVRWEDPSSRHCFTVWDPEQSKEKVS